MSRLLAALALAPTIVLAGCVGADEAADGSDAARTPVALGPVDGRDLPRADLERVQAGDVAPDFSLVSLAGPVVTLSDYRGSRNVILVFYRGWW